MSFTVVCDKCGNTKNVTPDSKRKEDNIDIWADYSLDVSIKCYNCQNEVKTNVDNWGDR